MKQRSYRQQRPQDDRHVDTRAGPNPWQTLTTFIAQDERYKIQCQKLFSSRHYRLFQRYRIYHVD